MAKVNALTALKVKNASASGRLADGGGLYLSTTNGGKRWVFIFRWQGKRSEMGLGSAAKVSLAEARKLAAEAREHVQGGRHPVREREARLSAMSASKGTLFGKFADDYVSSVEQGWRNEKHRQQWRNTLRDHAASIASKPVADVDTNDVLQVLQPLWLEKPETANRLRGRLEKVLAAAKARGLRSPDATNPAQWRGHLDVLLPKRVTLSRGHHPALPYSHVPDLMLELSGRPAMAARALEFLILCAARSGEVLGAKWEEIEEDTWIVPAYRMKAGRAHTVPLSTAAKTILAKWPRTAPGDYIFHGPSLDRPLSNMSMAMLLRRMKHHTITVHGFRSAFKDWALNETDYPDELSEEALAHIVGSKVRRAYRRGEAVNRRLRLMEEWGRFIAVRQGKVETPGAIVQDLGRPASER
jgi:integrase